MRRIIKAAFWPLWPLHAWRWLEGDIPDEPGWPGVF